MKITKTRLTQIIKEELARLTEAHWDHPPEPAGSLGGYGDTDLYGVDDESDEHTDNIERILDDAFGLKEKGFVLDIDIQLPGEQYLVMTRGGLGELGRIIGAGHGDWRATMKAEEALKANGYNVDVGPDGLTAMVPREPDATTGGEPIKEVYGAIGPNPRFHLRQKVVNALAEYLDIHVLKAEQLFREKFE